jgi:Protein of unknown function (DUF2975)
MRPETEQKLDKIKRISTGLRAVCKCLLVLIALLFIAASVGILAGAGVIIRSFDLLFPVAPLALSARLGLIAILALSLGVITKGLYHLDRLFSYYACGAFFTTQTANQIRQLGITAILWTGVNIIWLVAALRLSPAQRPMSYQLHLDSLFIGVVIIVISWFMDAAAEMREENDLTI